MTKKKRHQFSRIVVAYCVVMGTIITGVALGVCYIGGEISGSLVTALLAFWGGELLLLCLKRVLGDSAPPNAPAASEGHQEPTI